MKGFAVIVIFVVVNFAAVVVGVLVVVFIVVVVVDFAAVAAGVLVLVVVVVVATATSVCYVDSRAIGLCQHPFAASRSNYLRLEIGFDLKSASCHPFFVKSEILDNWKHQISHKNVNFSLSSSSSSSSINIDSSNR